MSVRNPHLLLFVGNGGVGKSRLMFELHTQNPTFANILKTDTTREPRKGMTMRTVLDEAMYDFVSPEYFADMSARGVYPFTVDQPVGRYATPMRHFITTIEDRERHGMIACVPSHIETYKLIWCPSIVIDIVPQGHFDERDEKRRAFDQREAAVSYSADITIVNSFADGGLETALRDLHRLIVRLTH